MVLLFGEMPSGNIIFNEIVINRTRTTGFTMTTVQMIRIFRGDLKVI